MAKEKPAAKPPISPDLPEFLAHVLDNVRQAKGPTPTTEEEAHLPRLFELLTPMMVADPRYRGEGKPPRVLREPMLLLSWDRRAGTWKCSITDKVLNVSTAIPVPTLLDALQAVERALASGQVIFSQRKPS